MSSSPIAAARRRTELGLILMAATITGAAYTLASLGKNAVIPPILVPFLLAVLGLLVVAHLANRVLAKGADGTILPLAALLHGIGYVIIARLSERSAGLQTTWTFVAIVAYVATLVVVQRASDLARYQWSFLAIGGGTAAAAAGARARQRQGGARIWVSLGPINFQPGEFAKIALALFFAGYLAEHRELIAAGGWRVGPFHLPELRHLLPIALAWGFAVVVMVAEKDLGSSLLFFTLFVVMMWVATERASYLVIGLVLFSGAAYVGLAAVRPRADPRRHLAQPVAAVRGQGLPDRAGDVRLRQRRHRRHRPRPRQPQQDPGRQDRLHLRRHRRGARPARHDRDPDRRSC